MEEGFIIINEKPDTNIDNFIYENKNNNHPKITQNNQITHPITHPITVTHQKYKHNLLFYFVISYKLSTISCALLQSPF